MNKADDKARQMVIAALRKYKQDQKMYNLIKERAVDEGTRLGYLAKEIESWNTFMMLRDIYYGVEY